MSRLLTVLLALLLAPAAHAVVVFDDGGVHLITTDLADELVVRDSVGAMPTHVTIAAGGVVGASFVFDTSTLILDGGIISPGVVTEDQAHFELRSTAPVFILGVIDARDASTVLMDDEPVISLFLTDTAEALVQGPNSYVIGQLVTTPGSPTVIFEDGGWQPGAFLYGTQVLREVGDGSLVCGSPCGFGIVHILTTGLTQIEGQAFKVNGEWVAPQTLEHQSGGGGWAVDWASDGTWYSASIIGQTDGMVGSQLELIAVPEPGQLAMLVPGVIALGALGRRRLYAEAMRRRD